MVMRGAGDAQGRPAAVVRAAAALLVIDAVPRSGLHGSGVANLLIQRMASVVSASGVGVVRGRLEAGPRWANDAFLAMSGYRRFDLAGLEWSTLTGGNAAVLTPAAVDGVAPAIECEFIRRDGSRWPVIVSRGIDPTDSAQLILFIVDLTSSRRANAEREAAALRYARFFEVARMSFWAAEPRDRGVAGTTTADLPPSETVLGHFGAQAALIHPDDRGFALEARQGAVTTARAYDIEVRARGGEGGDYRWTRLKAFPDTVDGAVVNWYGTAEDIHDQRVLSDAQAASEQRFKRLADDIPVIVWLTDLTSRATYLSKTWFDYTGQAEAEALGSGWIKAVLPEDLSRMLRFARCVAKGRAFDVDMRLVARNGSSRWFMCSGRPRFNAASLLIGFAGALTDIHDRKLAESELAAVQSRLSRALDGTGVGVWEWDAATDAVSVTGSALGASSIGGKPDDHQSIDYRAAIHPDDRERLLETMAEYVAGRCPEFAVEIRVRRRGGGWVWVLDRGLATARDADGRATGMVGTLTNIDDSKCAAERLRWTVDHDALTGLASRILFNTRLDAALECGRPVALVLLDIDDFKSVNDVHGHAAGDALLTVLAQRLVEFAGPEDTVARLGGDEFTLIIPDCGDPAHVTARLEALRGMLSSPFVHDGQSLTCRSSIGVAVSPLHGGDASTLLRSADIAMYTAKAGTGGVALYDPALGARVRSGTAALARVRAALDAGQVAPLYESVVRLSDGKVAGYEALAQVERAAGGPIDVHKLEANFGDVDLAVRLGTCIVDHVLADFTSWRAAGVEPEFVSVNVSLAELRQGDYAERLLAKLAAHSIPPGQLRIEFVETGLHGGRVGSSIAATLTALRNGGLLAGLDKFGVGSSSLQHLSQLPLAAVKIDRQFVRGVAEPGSDRKIVSAITGLGQSFGLRVVALGVETEAQAKWVAELGCTYGQGSWFGPALNGAATLATRRG